MLTWLLIDLNTNVSLQLSVTVTLLYFTEKHLTYPIKKWNSLATSSSLL